MTDESRGWMERILRRLLAPVLVRQEAALGQVAQKVRTLEVQAEALAARMEGMRSGLDARQDDLTHVQEQLAAALAGQTRRQDELVRVQERLAGELRSVIQCYEDLQNSHRHAVAELERVMAALQAIAEMQKQLVAALDTQARRDDSFMRSQEELTRQVHGVIDRLAVLVKEQEDIVRELHEVEQGHRALVKVQEDLATRIGHVEHGHEALVKEQAALQDEIVGVKKRGDALVHVQEAQREQVDEQREEVERIGRELVSVMARIDDLTTRMGRGEGTCGELRKDIERVREETSVLKGIVSGALERLTEKANGDSVRVSREALAKVDELAYVRFQDDQRGSEEEIRRRLSWYLQWVRGVATTSESYILDVGCGRGEFVALLRDEGFHARGVDINEVMVARARGKGLLVERDDLFNVLRKTGNEKLAGISAFHVLEHFPVDMQVRFFRLAFAALRPGGVLMLEFPNILSLRVAATDFYKDPTHERPLHPVTVEGWLRETGFKKIHVEFLHPYPKEECGVAHGELSEGVRMLCDVVFGNRDCAVVAVKGETTE